METSKNKISKALGITSGGLDSILAGLILRDQGLHVEWVCFETPFFSSEKAQKAARMTRIPLTVKNITATYLDMLTDPHCGYGQYMNPCLDCHALMLRIAGHMMRNKGFDFLFSGEVVGQRPMSQTKSSLRYVEKNSGFNGYILRPLSALTLPETIPEKLGMVDRGRLHGITGRSRKIQIELAEKFNITDYPAPGGGCLLTDKGYTTRLKDLFAHQNAFTENELHLLKHGRHIRLDDMTKIIVGRTKVDNENILRYHDPVNDLVIKVERYPGPITLMPGGGGTETIHLAARICAAYSKAPADASVDVGISRHTFNDTLNVRPISKAFFQPFMI